MLVFDEAFYFEKYPEVRQAVHEGRYLNGEDHFVRLGQTAGYLHRAVNPSCLDATAYRIRYPDVDVAIKAGECSSEVEHWISVGNREGRLFFPSAQLSIQGSNQAHRIFGSRQGVASLCQIRNLFFDQNLEPHGWGDGHNDKRKRLVFIASVDHANIMTQWAKAIREHSCLLNAVSICLRPHEFGYELAHDLDLSTSIGAPAQQESWLDGTTAERLAAVRGLLESTDWAIQADELRSQEVLNLFGCFTGVDLVGKLGKRRIAIYHAGPPFRKESQLRNPRDSDFLAQLTQPDLFRLGGSNVRPVFPVLETIPPPDEIRHRFQSHRLIILHAPSDPQGMGTIAIRRVIQKILAAFPERAIEYREITNAPNRVIIDQKRLSHILIDQFNDQSDQGGGGIGVSTFEGWAAGNVVLSSINHILPSVWQTWGIAPERLPLIDLGFDSDEFFKRLLALCRLPNHALAELAVAQGQIAYSSFAPARISEFFDELLLPQDAVRARFPAVHTRSDRAVLVFPHRPSPGLFHKQRYAKMLRSAFDAEMLEVEDEVGLYERVMALAPRLVITMNLPLYQTFSDRLIHQLPTSIRLVTWHDDLRREMHPNLQDVLSRSDAVISVLRDAVTCAGQFPEIEGKLWRLPWFIPSGIPFYQINQDPIRRCLLPGEVKGVRPIRAKAVNEIPPSLLARLTHPGYCKSSYAKDIVGKNFYDLIHDHACCLTDASVYRYAVAKYFEVPYTGSLLLAEDIPDLTEMGYRPGQHFLAVSQFTDLGALVTNVLANYDDYYAIRQAGQWLVQDRHTEVVRTAEAHRVAREIRKRLGLK